MKSKNKRVLTALIAVAICFAAAVTGASAASKITSGVSILNPRQNVHGNGYEWDNPHDTLTLTNLYIETKDDYGLKVPDGATVILKGTNRISASVAALYIGGDVIIKGSGTLILDGGKYGIFCNSSDMTDKLSIVGGKYEIKAGEDGIHSDIQKISVSNSDMTVAAGTDGIYGIDVVVSNGMKLKSDAGLFAVNSLSVEASNVSVAGKDAALICEKSLVITRMSIKAGDSLSSLSAVEEYGGQKAIVTKASWKYVKSSFL
ncbi:MAG: carbohydrate-binding domain-containing protein, partial [Clostridia bacterium]|nr:carbohydrate-binding domain-containing protein [Clostridia bacterium]